MLELEESISKEVDIDCRVHGNLISPRGKIVAKVEQHFKVKVRLPSEKESNTITVAGMRKCVEDTIPHLLMLADYFLVNA